MRRIVLDTNVLISAIGWKGNAYRIWDECVRGIYQLVMSPVLLSELEKVLRRPKFSFIPGAEQQRFVFLLASIAEMIEVQPYLNVITIDLSDNRVLECAIAGQVSAIVTGDHHLLDLRNY